MPDNRVYKGPERRRRTRRNTPERREMIRFELEKEARRKNLGRREADKLWNGRDR